MQIGKKLCVVWLPKTISSQLLTKINSELLLQWEHTLMNHDKIYISMKYYHKNLNPLRNAPLFLFPSSVYNFSLLVEGLGLQS